MPNKRQFDLRLYIRLMWTPSLVSCFVQPVCPRQADPTAKKPPLLDYKSSTCAFSWQSQHRHRSCVHVWSSVKRGIPLPSLGSRGATLLPRDFPYGCPDQHELLGVFCVLKGNCAEHRRTLLRNLHFLAEGWLTAGEFATGQPWSRKRFQHISCLAEVLKVIKVHTTGVKGIMKHTDRCSRHENCMHLHAIYEIVLRLKHVWRNPTVSRFAKQNHCKVFVVMIKSYNSFLNVLNTSQEAVIK